MDRNNLAYKKVLKHRKTCKKWGKGFCLDCFGEGLNRFCDHYDEEQRKELGLPSIDETLKQLVRSEAQRIYMEALNEIIKDKKNG